MQWTGFVVSSSECSSTKCSSVTSNLELASQWLQPWLFSSVHISSTRACHQVFGRIAMQIMMILYLEKLLFDFHFWHMDLIFTVKLLSRVNERHLSDIVAISKILTIFIGIVFTLH